MIRRPILLLSILLLGAAVVQAAVVALVSDEASKPSASNGKICTVCGPIGDGPAYDE